ncbi:hypothetical protein CYMTET_3997 [Cymbomonas tetramitiformis]|uniref:CRAL-TRIO domain-containing protein n=1 Tax=Cymbomonas tetramitiformis TaxID=36881 RepID=A0AAE0H3X0_9CHLO|nr:hypothetical protein CYMTET_3997 [Cymbomonas tetramitiformis]
MAKIIEPAVLPHSRIDRDIREKNQALITELALFKVKIQDAGLDLSLSKSPEEPLDGFLLRFLRARKGKVDLSMKMLENHLSWCRKWNLSELRQKTAYEVLQHEPSEIDALFPSLTYGHDLDGRPVVIQNGITYNTHKAVTLVSMDKLEEYHIWRKELIMERINHNARQSGVYLENTTAIVDIGGMTMKHVTKAFLALVKRLASLDQDQYPERLGQLFIINCPGPFPFVWRMIKPWIDPATVAKINIVSGDPNPTLQAAIPLSDLLSNYGGPVDFEDASKLPVASRAEMLAELEKVDIQAADNACPASEESVPAPAEMVAVTPQELRVDAAEATTLQGASASALPPLSATSALPPLSAQSSSSAPAESMPSAQEDVPRCSADSLSACQTTSSLGTTGSVICHAEDPLPVTSPQHICESPNEKGPQSGPPNEKGLQPESPNEKGLQPESPNDDSARSQLVAPQQLLSAGDLHALQDHSDMGKPERGSKLTASGAEEAKQVWRSWELRRSQPAKQNVKTGGANQSSCSIPLNASVPRDSSIPTASWLWIAMLLGYSMLVYGLGFATATYLRVIGIECQ